ncbi:hypothetical protein F5883DRAFT_653765 [Diaporthe sp. PMI_573]|nr:hypothetical protein F5883DRAFT_653765 [Diaporthaceae sp. PMI_573]
MFRLGTAVRSRRQNATTICPAKAALTKTQIVNIAIQPESSEQDKARQDILDGMKSMLQSFDENFTAGLGEVKFEIRELKSEMLRIGPSYSMQEPPELNDN